MKLRIIVSLLAAALFVSHAHAATLTLKPDEEKSTVTIEASATGHDFTGVLEKFVIDVRVDDATSAVQSARFEFDFKDLDTAKPKRDKKMLSWLEHTKHPKGVFVLEKITKTKTGDLIAEGVMSIHGKDVKIKMPVTLERKAGKFTIDGTTVLDTQEFGLKKIRMALLLTVDPEVKVIFHIEGDLVPEKAAP